MALSDDCIDELSREMVKGNKSVNWLASKIEAEVREQDEALIRQLVEALVECKDSTQERIDTLTESGIDKHKPRYFHSYVQDLQRAADAISAARARLEGKP